MWRLRISWFILILACNFLQAQTTAIEKITIENGLSQGMIFDILQTRDGFLWVATKDGLNRYDGYNFKVFTNDPFDSFSLGENTVISLFEDSRGWLWAGLETRGVDLYDPKTGRFHHFPANFNGSRLFESANANRILESPDGAIWFTQSRGGVIRISIPETWKDAIPDQADLEHITTVKQLNLTDTVDGKKEELPHNFHDLMLMRNGHLLATANKAQFEIDPVSMEGHLVNQHLLPRVMIHFISGDDAFDGDMWCHASDEIFEQQEFWRIRHGQVSIFKLPLSNSVWRRLDKGKNGHVWVVDRNRVWDMAPGQDLDLSKPDFTFDAQVTRLIYDRSGNLWIGTAGYGLRKINNLTSKFHSGGNGRSIKGIWASGGRYFCKPLFKICEFYPETNEICPESAFPNGTERQLGLVFEPDGTTWLLNKIPETTTGLLQRYAPGKYGEPERTYVFNATLTACDPFIRARDGRFWIASDDRRLICFDPWKERFEYFEFGHLFGPEQNTVLPIALAEGPNKELFIGSQVGLIRAMPGPNKVDFQLITADPNNRDGLNNNSIACVLPEEEGRMWIGTKGGGINLMDLSTGKCKHITTLDGLLNNVVYGILPGSRRGEYWCSTNRGLARIIYGPEKPSGKAALQVTTFTSAVGLQDNEFNTYAYCLNNNGELLFGGVNGLNRFFPQDIRPDTTPPGVFIVGLEINHQKAGPGIAGSPIAIPINRLTRLELPYFQNNISFEFSALDFTDPSKNRYRYQLEGLEKDWVETGNNRFAHFSHLNPGHYVFRVQGSNGESGWCDAPPVVIVIHPPWYASNLAYLCYAALLIWGGWRAYRFQIKRVKEKEQLAFERRETERVKALEQMKTRFFSNVTHELRTPLTLIIEPLRQFLKHPDDPKGPEKVQLAETNSRQLLELVNQLLDMAKLEGGQMTLDLRREDLTQRLRDVFERFLPLAEKRGIKMKLARLPEIPLFAFDPGKVELILNNLLSNALKFSPAGSEVQVQCSRDGHQALIQVRDTGIGIAPEHLEKIFDRFYQVENGAAEHLSTSSGTGIGLTLSRELALMMGGSLTVQSKPGAGSVFSLKLPLEPSGAESNERLPGTVVSGTIVSETQVPPGEEPLLLLVEDNDDLRKFIRDSVGRGWRVLEADNGQEGVRKALELLPDLVISDVMMPLKDGYALCEEIKNNELTAHIPVILLTAKSGLDDKIKGLRTGADDYVGKPFSSEELRARMENLVKLRRNLREHYLLRGGALRGATAQEQTDGDFLTKPDRDFLEKCYRLLESRLDSETFGVEEMAQAMFISRAQLHRKLKAICDQSPIDFIRNYRLDRAVVLLKNKEGNVSEVSRMVGFVNEKHFSTVFKERFGKSPSEV